MRAFPLTRSDVMKFIRAIFALIALAPVALSASSLAAPSVKVGNAWVRAALPGQQATGAYLELTSSGAAALVAARSPVAARTEIHTMALEGGVMRMRPVPRIELPAGATVRLAPGGLHLMLMDLTRPLEPGDRVPLVLTVQGSGTSAVTLEVEVEAEVRGLGGQPAPHHRH
jgi:periplasmic copper chaperone A